MLFSSAPRQNSSVRISQKQIRPFVPVLLHHIFNEFFYLYGVFTFWREMFHLSSSEFSSRSLLILSYLSCGIEFHEHWIYVNVFMHATTPPRPDSSWRRLHRMWTVNMFPNIFLGWGLGQTTKQHNWVKNKVLIFVSHLWSHVAVELIKLEEKQARKARRCDSFLQIWNYQSEMEKRADTADISVLFLFGCAIFFGYIRAN